MTTNLPTTDPARPPGPPRPRGFTLIELMIVMTIIGILVTLILIAAKDGIRQAEVRATQALILKLESGLNDRLDALLQFRPDPNFTHGYLAGIYYGGGNDLDGQPVMNPPAILRSGYPNTEVRTTARAQAIALADYLKAEMPDVFRIQNVNPSATDYPLDFAALSFPGTPLTTHGNFILPLGHMIQGPRNDSTVTGWGFTGYGDGNIGAMSPGVFSSSNPRFGLAGSGIFGASYAAAAGVYKNLGYVPAGYDMVDNNGNGLVDEWLEGVDIDGNGTISGSAETDLVADVRSRLAAHTHETARAEMLYALLVEGQGPLGSTFNADDFSDREVKDTDGDGLPEFVDAWGKPIQFFRWPVLYHSDSQRGQYAGADMNDASNPTRFLPPYKSVFETREINPLDPNQSLTAPAWWLETQNPAFPFVAAKGSPTYGSGGVEFFERFFHRLTEPLQYQAPAGAQFQDLKYWDRGGFTGLGYRRAFFTKPLILSSGPDMTPGVWLFPTAPSALKLNRYENAAMQFVPTEAFGDITDDIDDPIPATPPDADMIKFPASFMLRDSGQDDITNHNVGFSAGSGG